MEFYVMIDNDELPVCGHWWSCCPHAGSGSHTASAVCPSGRQPALPMFSTWVVILNGRRSVLVPRRTRHSHAYRPLSSIPRNILNMRFLILRSVNCLPRVFHAAATTEAPQGVCPDSRSCHVNICLHTILVSRNTSSMSQVGHRDIEGGHPGILSAFRSLPHQIYQCVLRCIVTEGHRRQPEGAQAQLLQPRQAESHLCDSSWPLYSIYPKFAQEEDDKIAERCQRNADGMLVFVSPREYFRVAAHTNLRNIGRSILSNRRYINYRHVPRSETKSAGCLCVLSREYLSASRHSGF